MTRDVTKILVALALLWIMAVAMATDYSRNPHPAASAGTMLSHVSPPSLVALSRKESTGRYSGASTLPSLMLAGS